MHWVSATQKAEPGETKKSCFVERLESISNLISNTTSTRNSIIHKCDSCDALRDRLFIVRGTGNVGLRRVL
jgi:hypothetical protein